MENTFGVEHSLNVSMKNSRPIFLLKTFLPTFPGSKIQKEDF